MLHTKRRWYVTPASSPEQLARDLTEQIWTLCTAFELNGYLFLNDSTSEDGAQEYAVVKRSGPDGRPLQVESITFGWSSYEEALADIHDVLAGRMDAAGAPVEVAWEPPARHGTCPLCA